MIQVRPYEPDDRAFVLALAPRLQTGRQPWRDAARWLQTVEAWIAKSIDGHERESMVLIAEDETGTPLGFATVSHSEHFTGQPQAYIGELVTKETAEGRGVGTALVAACAQWAQSQGYDLLAVSTGAGNERALRLYDHLGFRQEDVTLTKRLKAAPAPGSRAVGPADTGNMGTINQEDHSQ